MSNILCDDVWFLWHYSLCHFFPILKLDIYICYIPQDQLSVSYAPCLIRRPPLCETLSQIWLEGRLISFSEATVIHGNALFTAAVVCQSVRHGPGPALPYLSETQICAWRPETRNQTTLDRDLFLDSRRHSKSSNKTGYILLQLKISPKPSHSATVQLHATSMKLKNMTGGPTVFCPQMTSYAFLIQTRKIAWQLQHTATSFIMKECKHVAHGENVYKKYSWSAFHNNLREMSVVFIFPTAWKTFLNTCYRTEPHN